MLWTMPEWKQSSGLGKLTILVCGGAGALLANNLLYVVSNWLGKPMAFIPSLLPYTMPTLAWVILILCTIASYKFLEVVEPDFGNRPSSKPLPPTLSSPQMTPNKRTSFGKRTS